MKNQAHEELRENLDEEILGWVSGLIKSEREEFISDILAIVADEVRKLQEHEGSYHVECYNETPYLKKQDLLDLLGGGKP